LQQDATLLSRRKREKESFMVGHDEPAIAIAALIAWGFAMAALGLDWKRSRQELGWRWSAVDTQEVFAYGVGRRDSRGTGALDVGRVRALVDAT
jgi:hypothetical protein